MHSALPACNKNRGSISERKNVRIWLVGRIKIWCRHMVASPCKPEVYLRRFTRVVPNPRLSPFLPNKGGEGHKVRLSASVRDIFRKLQPMLPSNERWLQAIQEIKGDRRKTLKTCD